VSVTDKEAQLGLHASGRNSGSINSGFYYSAKSLKARFTHDGKVALKNFICERKLPSMNAESLSSPKMKRNFQYWIDGSIAGAPTVWNLMKSRRLRQESWAFRD
jgi:L-2-hydroxyglutarate oxidase LhgO